MRKVIFLFAVLAMSSIMATAQSTINDAGEKFNQGIENFKAKEYTKAIALYNEALTICDALGEEGAELGDKIKNMIPSAYTSYGKELIKAKKIDEALQILQQGIEEAVKYGNAKAEKSSKSLISNIYVSKAGTAYSNDDFDNTLSNCELAIQYNAKSAKAYLFKALAYSQKDDEENLMSAVDNAIKFAGTDEKTANSAKATALTYLTNKAQVYFSKGNFTDAISTFDKALVIDPVNQTALYIKTSSLNKLNKTDAAIETGLIGLTAPNDNNDQFLGINLELARAYEIKGDTESACKYYSIAAQSVNFKEEAEAKMKDVLKCK